MKRTKEDANVTRQDILKASLQVFSQYGYEATKLEDIAEAAKVTRGAIYHHFGGKAGLYNALVDQIILRLNGVAEEAIETGGSVLDIMQRVFVQVLVSIEQDSEFRAIHELILRRPISDPAVEESQQRRLEGDKQTIALIEESFQDAIDNGEVRADVHPRTVALTMLALQNGLLTLWFVDQTLFSLKDEAERVVDIFLRGIAAK